MRKTRAGENLRVDRGLIVLAKQVCVDLIKQCECKQHHRTAEKYPGLLPGVRLVECFDVDLGVSRFLLDHAATLSPLSMVPVHVDGIQGIAASAPRMPAL